MGNLCNRKFIIKDGIRYKKCAKKGCPTKGKMLSEDDFHKSGPNREYLNSYCKECCKELSAIRSRKSVYRRRYGIDASVYDELLEKQGGKCRICGSDSPSGFFENKKKIRFFCLDHCHETMAPRGLLCSPCNRALGFLQDSPQVVESALEYLKGFKK